MENLLLAEHDYQVQDFISRGLHINGEWIALGPGAMWALDQKGFDYKIPEDFYSSRELEEICLKNHETVEWLCNRLDEYIIEKHHELEEWKIRPFLFSIFPLTILFDGMISRIFQIKSIIRKNPECTIWTHVSPHYPWGVFDITFSNEENLWGHLLSLQGWNCKIELLNSHLLPKPTTLNLKQNEAKFKNWAKAFIKKSFHLHNLVHNVRSKDWKSLLVLFKGKAKDSLLIYGSISEWSHIIPYLRGRGWRVFFADAELFKNGKCHLKGSENSCYEVIENDSAVLDCFKFQGINFYPILKDRIDWIFDKTPGFTKQIIASMRKHTKMYNVKAMLISITTTFLSHAVNQIGRKLGVKVYKWQHGFAIYNGRINQLYEFNDLMTTDMLFVFGKEVEKGYSTYKDKFPTNIVSIGSASIDKLRAFNNLSVKELDDKQAKQILYVTTNYNQNNWYCDFSPPFRDRFLFQDQLAIIRQLNVLSERYDIEITIKLSPGSLYQDPPFIKSISKNPMITLTKDSPSFSDLLSQHDIVIIDSPTTTLLQAISTNKPVFVLMRHIGYPDNAQRMLEKRAICAKSVSMLIESLEDYLKTNTYMADMNNNEFLKAYGNFYDDGKSVERAMEIVEETINK